MIHIAIAEDHPLLESALQYTLGNHGSFHVMGHVDLDRCDVSDSKLPHVIIMESASYENGLCARLRQRCPGVKVLLLCGNQNAQAICLALQNGVSGCLSRRSTPTELARAIRSVADGEQYLSPSLAMQMLNGATQKPALATDHFAALTSREEQILKLLGVGLSNKEIGWRLTISEKTVKHYLTSILGKLNVRNRVQAALLVAGRQDPLICA